jgi:DcuC family C4-dicarboxylate transporter
MILVMTAVISASSVIMGSGNAPFFAFAALAPTVAASVNIDPVVIAMPMQLASGIARSVSPITAVIVAVCGISGVSPFLVVRRTFLPMLVGLVVLLISNMVLFG